MLAFGAAITVACTFGAASAQTGDGSDEAVPFFNAAQDLHERGDFTGAIRLYDKALKAMPEFPEAEYQRGMAELALGDRDEAERSLRSALRLREDWSPALTSLGSLLVDKGRFVEAEALLTKALAADPQNSPALSAMIELRLRTKASPAVLQSLLDSASALTQKAKPTAAIWTARAALESALGKGDAAKSSLARAFAIEAKNRAALFLLAQIALKEGDIVRSKEAAAALERLGADADTLSLLKAGIAASEGDLEQASKLLASLPADSASANELRAFIAANGANAAELEKLVEKGPTNISALGRLCTVLRRDEPLKAIEYCRRASEAEPSNVMHVIGSAAALIQARQFETAVTVLRKTVELVPDNSTARANLATALFELKRYAEAREQFEWLTLKQPNLAAAYYFLAICYDRLGKDLDAMANYQQYLRLADPVANKLDIEKVNLRLGQMQKKRK